MYLDFQLPLDDFPSLPQPAQAGASATGASFQTEEDDLAKQFSSLGHEKIENAQQVVYICHIHSLGFFNFDP